MMFLIRFWRSLTKKDSVERAEYEIKILVVLQFFDVFFHRSGFSGSDPDFLPIRIRTQKKKSDPYPERNPGSETLHFGLVSKYYYFFSLKPTILQLFTVLYCSYYFLNKPVPYFSICHQKLCKEL